MRSKTRSLATLGLLSAVLLGLITLVGCGGGGGSSSSTTTSSSPAVTLSATTLTFSSGVNVQSAAQSVTVTNSGSATLTFSGITASPSSFVQTNNCGTSLAAGGSCTINVTFTPTAAGTVSGTLTITDNASNSPQTVTLSGTGYSVSLSTNTLTFSGVAVGTTSAAQSVTLNNAGTAALAISSITISGDFAISKNTCGSSVGASGSCTISVTFSPLGSGPWTGTLTIVDGAGTQTVALTGTTSFTNTAQVTVSFGPNGNTGNTATNYYDGIFTTVTVCVPGSTTNCATIPNVLVDTGSFGLRVFSNLLVNQQGSNITLPSVIDSLGNPLDECVEYSDTSYTWGPVQLATVQIGGETASQVPGGTANAGIPIQVISANATAPTGAACTLDGGPSDNTVSAFGSNGVLGIGNLPQDCGTDCTSSSTAGNVSPYPYIDCPATGCEYVLASLGEQVWNPVAAFSSADTNGTVLQLPSIPAAGQVTATGTLIFGIGTEANNAIPNTATLYELDENLNFPSTVFAGVTYNSSGFLDSGTPDLAVSDHTTLTTVTGITTVDCPSGDGYYCPSSTLTLNITNSGVNGTKGQVTLSIANADSEFSANPSFAAFDNIGTDSGTDPSSDFFGLGMPFFFGNTIFTGIANATYPNGYYAF